MQCQNIIALSAFVEDRKLHARGVLDKFVGHEAYSREAHAAREMIKFCDELLNLHVNCTRSISILSDN